MSCLLLRGRRNWRLENRIFQQLSYYRRKIRFLAKEVGEKALSLEQEKLYILPFCFTLIYNRDGVLENHTFSLLPSRQILFKSLIIIFSCRATLPVRRGQDTISALFLFADRGYRIFTLDFFSSKWYNFKDNFYFEINSKK